MKVYETIYCNINILSKNLSKVLVNILTRARTGLVVKHATKVTASVVLAVDRPIADAVLDARITTDFVSTSVSTIDI